MADIAARREARRRKILANSKNRLEFITGEHNGPLNEADEAQDNLQDLNNKNWETETNNFLAEAETESVSEPNNFFSRVSSLFEEPDEETLCRNNLFEKYSKIFIAFLGMLVRLLIPFKVQSYFNTSVMLPFLLTELVLQLLKPKQQENNVYLALVLSLYFNTDTAKFVLQIVKMIRDFFTNMALYFFMFTLVHISLDFV